MAARPLANGLILMIRVRIPPINLGQDSHLCMKQWSRSPKIDGFPRSSVFWVKNCSNRLLSSQDFKSWISRKQKLQIKINSNGSSRCRKKDKQNETHDLNLIGMSKIFVQPFDQVLTSRGSTPSHLRSFSSLSVSLLRRRRGLKKLVRYSFNIQVELFDIKCS